ncbi:MULTISPECIES: hypothetical protein [unclassified Novosphingobium]|uniref:hypothetical protein n=1 Tax=unclassified Novosphingobium TaxID=2644732 RepID=UPI001F079AC9|nr:MULTISPECIES: hypothetical protein [unclassified Novosphingobium]
MTALTKVVPARRITVLPEGQSSKFQSTLPATRSADIKPGGLAAASVGLLVLDCPNGRIFNGEAKGAQMLYPLTRDSWLHCLKSARNEARIPPETQSCLGLYRMLCSLPLPAQCSFQDSQARRRWLRSQRFGLLTALSRQAPLPL